MNACPRCENEIYPELFEQEVVCDKCGALLAIHYIDDDGNDFLVREIHV